MSNVHTPHDHSAKVINLATNHQPNPLGNSEYFNRGSDKNLTTEDRTFADLVRAAMTSDIQTKCLESGQWSNVSDIPAEYSSLQKLVPDYAIAEAARWLSGEDCDLATIGEVALLATFPALCDAMNLIYPDQYSHSS